MAQMSNFLEDKLIDHCFRNLTYAQAGIVYLALYSSDPTDADVGTELSGSGYARQAATFDAPSDGETQNTADIIYPVATANWTTVTHVGLRDAASGGNLLMHQALTTPVDVLKDNNFRMPLGQFSLLFA
jgi:hypothetical protein